MSQIHKIIKNACSAIAKNEIEEAKKIIDTGYPFSPLKNEGRRYSNYQKTKIFIRDGFIDRYSGDKMIFPPVLRLMSKLMPKEFPFHKNWKTTECHMAYWQLLPTIDHVVPVSRGGKDQESNWVCTSQLRNSAKSNWLLKELGWYLHEPGDIKEWDGLTTWFLNYTEKNKNILNDSYINSWHKALQKTKRT
ncbi:MAG TPA: HNH endonuclease [Aeromonadales bacterium]|nr:HNH endonuclease [Aeromonadales bacterium]